MAQQIINTGAAANDGTGDPLRTAFTETNSNFTEIYTAGPVGSNVRITNNTILTLNTNGNLVLAPNGTGRVVSNVDVVPNTANVRNLGANGQRWSTVYAQYLDVSANTTFGRDLTVGGNLTVTGDIVQVGNIITDAKTIQLANTASTANAASGSGVTVGANDDIATLLYNSTGNVWTMNIGVSAAGNVTAPYFVGNGSQLTGLPAQYGNSNVVTLLAGFGNNAISTTGNVTGGYLIGNGSALTSITGANVTGTVANATYATTAGSANSATTSGTVTANAQANITLVGTLANLSVTGNITTTANISGGFILGNISQANGFPAQYGNSNVTTLLSNLGSNTISTTGNVSVGNLILARGGAVYETNIPSGGLTGNTIALKPSGGTDSDQQLLIYPTITPGTDINHLHLTSGNLYNTELFLGNDDLYVKLANTGNIVVNSNNGVGNSAQWVFGTDGTTIFPGSLTGTGASPAPSINGFDSINSVTVSASGNITGAYISGNGSGLTNLPAPTVAQDTTSVGDMSVMTYDGNIKYVSNATIEPATGSIKTAGNISATGNITGAYIFGNGSQLTGVAASYGNSNVETLLSAFGNNTVSTTGNITAGNLKTSGQIQSTVFTGGNISWSANNQVDFQGAIKVGGTGVIKGPGGASSITLNNNGANIPILGVTNTSNSTSTTTGALIVSGGAGVAGNVYAGGLVSAAGNIVTTGNFVGNGAALSNVTVSIAGNIVGTQPNVTLVAGSYNYVFDNTGILTLPAPPTGNEGGELDLTKAGSSTLSGNTVVIDQYVDRIRFFEGGGTNRGVYIDLSKAPAGVSGQLQFKSSAMVNRNVAVTLGNLNIVIPTTGNASMQIYVGSGSLTVNGSSQYVVAGVTGSHTLQNFSVTTTPTYLWAPDAFNTAGDISIWTISSTTNSWRLTLQTGSSYTNNLLMIEQLV